MSPCVVEPTDPHNIGDARGVRARELALLDDAHGLEPG
jgi:hypothetical protein